MIDFTALSAVLEKVIQPSVKNQLYKKAPMWQLLGGWSAEEQVAKRANVNVDRFENNQMYIPIMTQNSSGVVSTGINGTYVYGQPQLNTTIAAITTLVGSFTIPKQVLNVKDAGAVVKPLTFYSKSLAQHMAMDANRQTYGDSTGTIATTAGTGTATTALALAASVNGDIDYGRYLPIGTNIKIGANAVVTVTAVGNNAVTISSAQSWAAGAAVVKVDGDGNPAAELAGFKSMIAASGVYQGLDFANEATWNSFVDSTAETLTTSNMVTKMQQAFFKANKTGGVNWIIMNSKAFQLYGNSLQGQIRFDSKDVLYGGWKGLEFMGGNAMILLDYDCPDDRILFLSTEDLVFGEFQPLEFEKGTDGTLLKLAGKLNYEVTASWMGQVGTTIRSSNALMSNKTC